MNSQSISPQKLASSSEHCQFPQVHFPFFWSPGICWERLFCQENLKRCPKRRGERMRQRCRFSSSSSPSVASFFERTSDVASANKLQEGNGNACAIICIPTCSCAETFPESSQSVKIVQISIIGCPLIFYCCIIVLYYIFIW